MRHGARSSVIRLVLLFVFVTCAVRLPKRGRAGRVRWRKRAG